MDLPRHDIGKNYLDLPRGMKGHRCRKLDPASALCLFQSSMHSPLPASDFDPGIGSHIGWWLQRYPGIDMIHLDRQIFQKTDASPLIRMIHSRSKHATTTRKRRFANDRKEATVSGSMSVFSGVTSFWRKSIGFAIDVTENQEWFTRFGGPG